MSGRRSRAASRAVICDVPFPGKTGNKEFLFLFDYGEEWYFGVKLLRQLPALDAGVCYPAVVASAGVAPPQYPDYPEDEEDEGGEENGEGEFDIIQLDATGMRMLGLDKFGVIDSTPIAETSTGDDTPTGTPESPDTPEK